MVTLFPPWLKGKEFKLVTAKAQDVWLRACLLDVLNTKEAITLVLVSLIRKSTHFKVGYSIPKRPSLKFEIPCEKEKLNITNEGKEVRGSRVSWGSIGEDCFLLLKVGLFYILITGFFPPLILFSLLFYVMFLPKLLGSEFYLWTLVKTCLSGKNKTSILYV